jgi:hypothetical protein
MMPNSGLETIKKTRSGPTKHMIVMMPTIAPYVVVAYANNAAININNKKTNQPEYLSISNFLHRKLPIVFFDRLLEGSIFSKKFSKD